MKNSLSKLNIKFFLLIISLLLTPAASNAAKEIIKINNVKEVSLDEIGVLNGKNGGLEKHIWYESDRSYMEALLVTMPMKTDSEILQKLNKLILLSTATPPRSKKAILPSVFDVKLKKLAMLGDYKNIAKMIEQVPQTRHTEQMHKTYITSYFIDNNYDKGCKEYTNYLKKYPSVFWSKIRIICNSYSKKQSNVDFDIKLLKEQGYELSKDFLDIVSKLQKGKESDAKKGWNNLLSKEVLSLPEIIINFPNPKYALKAKIDKQRILEWLDKTKEMDNQERLDSTIFMFANIDALGTQVPINTWRQFVMYAVSNNLSLPDYAIYRLLKHTPSDGERILTITHLLKGRDIKTIPDHLFTQVTYSLHRMGFKHEARDLAERRLF